MNALIVHIERQRSIGKVLDKTWREIYDAFTQGCVVVSEGENPGDSVYSIAWMTMGGYHVDYGEDVPYIIMLNGIGGTHKFQAASEDEYPEESYD